MHETSLSVATTDQWINHSDPAGLKLNMSIHSSSCIVNGKSAAFFGIQIGDSADV